MLNFFMKLVQILLSSIGLKLCFKGHLINVIFFTSLRKFLKVIRTFKLFKVNFVNFELPFSCNGFYGSNLAGSQRSKHIFKGICNFIRGIVSLRSKLDSFFSCNANALEGLHFRKIFNKSQGQHQLTIIQISYQFESLFQCQIQQYNEQLYQKIQQIFGKVKYLICYSSKPSTPINLSKIKTMVYCQEDITFLNQKPIFSNLNFLYLFFFVLSQAILLCGLNNMNSQINKIRMSQSFNKHYQRYQLPEMTTQQRSKKPNKLVNETADIYLQQSTKNRNSGNYVPLKNRNNYETLKTNHRKSIEINTSKNNTLQPQQRNYYKRGQQVFQKQPQSRRYDEEEIRGSSKSPYLKRQFQGRTTSLNRSTHKIKSSNFMSKNSNQNNQLYKQPRSSLSQHYDPQDTSLHKRRVSVAGNERNYVLEQAKEYYKQNQFEKSIDLLKKYIKFNRTCSEARYFLGMSLINNNQFSLGIQELLETLAIDPKYKKSLYLVIALAFKKLNKINDAIDILTKGLENFPDYYDCLVYRGKMYLKGQNYQNAIKDFNKAIQINPKKGFAFLGKGTAEKQLGMLDQAIQTLTQGCKSDMDQACLEKRGMCYFDMKKFDKAIHDFQKCKDSNATGGSLHYIKGITYYKLRKPIQAILAFQQSLKQDTNQESVTASVEMMMKIKIEDKDFYEAYHILNRTNNIEINKQVIEEWRLFLEGTLFMMKKKCKEGINTLKNLLAMPIYTSIYEQIVIKKNKERYEFLKPLAHLYKAFGELSEGNVDAAKEDYRQYDILCKKITGIDRNLSKIYNSLIIEAEQKFPKNCLHLIQQAVKMIPNKPEPHLFLAFQKVQNSLQKQMDKKQQNIDFIIDEITTAISHLPQLSNNHISTFYYYRSIMYLYKQDFNKAVADVDKAIEKSQDNIPKYFYLRGLIFAIFGNFSQSVQDLSVAISLDDKYAKPYLERAKCLQIQGSSNEAFLDLQKYITLAPQDPFIHKYAGFLLFQNCAYEDCLAAFSHGSQDVIDHEMLLTKAKCHFLLNNTEQSLELFRKYQQQTMGSDFKTDIQLIQISSCQINSETTGQQYKQKLRKIQKMIDTIKNEETECKIFKLRDMHQIKASIYLLMGDYETSLFEFDRTLHFFRLEKKRQLEKQFIQDTQEFEDEWSEVQIKFNISLCHLGMKNYDQAYNILVEFEKSSQRGKNWDQFIQLLANLKAGKISCTKNIKIDTFEQNHRISKNWPLFKMPGYEIYLSMAFSYPFVQPPQMLPEFDESLFLQFHMNKVEKKPEAPWINRQEKGLVFTPYIQNFENLELSITTKKQDDDENESQKNKPVSQIDRSVELSSSQFHLETQALKQRFKLDSLVQMRLKKLMQKKESAGKK